MMNATTSRTMKEVPRSEWPFMTGIESKPINVWLSNDYLAVLYEQRINGMRRLTVNRTRRDRSKRPGQGTDWRDGITWDELQRIKNECLGEDTWCVEVYPAESDLVNVYNMRHLWVLDGPPETRFPKEAYVSDDKIDAALEIVRKAIRR